MIKAIHDKGSSLILLYLSVLRQSVINAERGTHPQNHSLD